MMYAGLDLGSTSIKAALYEPGQPLKRLISSPAPPLSKDGLSVTGDANAYRDACLELLDQLAPMCPSPTPLFITSQRSSFVLWNSDGVAVTPMIHWSDRSAADWVATRKPLQHKIAERCGLPLSPHYAGPKLAKLSEQQSLNNLRFGTLETWVAQSFEGEHAFSTDPTMASRTLLYNLNSLKWGSTIHKDFDLPNSLALPTVLPSLHARDAHYGPFQWSASLGDQSASTLSIQTPHIRVNLGTGGFVLHPLSAGAPVNGLPWLTTPLGPLHPDGSLCLAREGTIHSVAKGIDQQAKPPTQVGAPELYSDTFIYPDDDGWGAPRWRSNGVAVIHSPQRPWDAIPKHEKRWLWVESVLFRVREILDGIHANDSESSLPVVLSGGLSNDPVIASMLANVLGIPVYKSQEAEATLLGICRFGANESVGLPATEPALPNSDHSKIEAKYLDWSAWSRSI